MTFPDWIQSQPHGTLKRLERETGVAYSTLHRARIGEPIGSYATAKKIADATAGAVTVAELCEAAPAAPDDVASSR